MTATLVLSLLLLSAADAPAARVRLPAITPAPQPQPIEFAVMGVGKTREDAEEDALEVARKRVIDELRRLRPSLRWEPNTQFLRDNAVTGVTDKEPSPSDLPGVGILQVVELKFTVTARQMRDMLVLDRQERQRDRHVQTFKVLGALLAFGFLFAGYARLEEICRGFFSGLLKVGLLAGLAVVGAGLWWSL